MASGSVAINLRRSPPSRCTEEKDEDRNPNYPIPNNWPNPPELRCMKDSKNEAHQKAVQELVETYCKADYGGANLSTDNYKKSSLPGFVVAGEYEAPGWDTVSLVKAYSIKTVAVKGENASVEVQYEVLGEVPGAQEVEVKKQKENYIFRLKKQGKSWKLIIPADLKPHIAIDTAIRHIRELYETEKASQPNAPKVIERLQELKRSSQTNSQTYKHSGRQQTAVAVLSGVAKITHENCSRSTGE